MQKLKEFSSGASKTGDQYEKSIDSHNLVHVILMSNLDSSNLHSIMKYLILLLVIILHNKSLSVV